MQFIYLAEAYPVSIRGNGYAVVGIVNSIGRITSQAIVLELERTSFKPIYFFMFICILALVATFWMEETLGK